MSLTSSFFNLLLITIDFHITPLCYIAAIQPCNWACTLQNEGSVHSTVHYPWVLLLKPLKGSLHVSGTLYHLSLINVPQGLWRGTPKVSRCSCFDTQRASPSTLLVSLPCNHFWPLPRAECLIYHIFSLLSTAHHPPPFSPLFKKNKTTTFIFSTPEGFVEEGRGYGGHRSDVSPMLPNKSLTKIPAHSRKPCCVHLDLLIHLSVCLWVAELQLLWAIKHCFPK